MLTLPAKKRRKKQSFVAIRAQMPRRYLARQAAVFFSEVRDFVAARAIDDAGPGFLRYLSVSRDGELDMEIGYLTGRPHPGSGPIRSGVLPSGTFLSAEWTGPFEKLPEINAMLPAWASHAGIELDVKESGDGVAYGCRMELFHITNRHTEDEAKYRTEILMLTKPLEDAA
jgi:effector-binding domain-containing protein